MPLLLLVSLIWAFSFGLIKIELAGLDPAAVGALRLGAALLVFLPFFRWRGLSARHALTLAAIGAVQFGVMYVLYLASFRALRAYEVALFTITTPLYVALIDAGLRRRFDWRHLAASLLAVAGAGVIMWRQQPDLSAWHGVLLVQGSNVCFAAGQLAWRVMRPRLGPGATDASVFAVPYAGALVATLAWSLSATDWAAFAPTARQWITIGYLGALASGAGFFLWNRGATQVNAGTLAAFNNVKIPLAIAASLLVFGEKTDPGRLAVLLLGGALMAAGVWVAERRQAS